MGTVHHSHPSARLVTQARNAGTFPARAESQETPTRGALAQFLTAEKLWQAMSFTASSRFGPCQYQISLLVLDTFLTDYQSANC